MALTLTEEVKPEISENKLNEALDNIYSLYLNIGKKAKAYCDAVVKLGTACSQFDNSMNTLGYNGMTKREYYTSITGRLGFGYNQFMKVKQIAEATKLVENKEVHKVYDLIDQNDVTGFHLIIDGEQVPCTIDNLQRGIADKKSDNQTAKDNAEEVKLSVLEKLLSNFPEPTTDNQRQDFEDAKSKAQSAEQNFNDLKQAEEDAIQARKDAKVALNESIEVLKAVKQRVVKHPLLKEKEAEKEKKAQEKQQEKIDKAEKALEEAKANT